MCSIVNANVLCAGIFSILLGICHSRSDYCSIATFIMHWWIVTEVRYKNNACFFCQGLLSEVEVKYKLSQCYLLLKDFREATTTVCLTLVFSSFLIMLSHHACISFWSSMRVIWYFKWLIVDDNTDNCNPLLFVNRIRVLHSLEGYSDKGLANIEL